MRVGEVALDLSFKGIDEIEFLIANVGRVKMGLIKCVLSNPSPDIYIYFTAIIMYWCYPSTGCGHNVCGDCSCVFTVFENIQKIISVPPGAILIPFLFMLKKP